MVERSRGDPMVACYIDSSFPALLHFAYKYADSPEKAILANANAGQINKFRQDRFYFTLLARQFFVCTYLLSMSKMQGVRMLQEAL